MKTLVMPVRLPQSTIPSARATRPFRSLLKAIQYAVAITLALLFGLVTTVVVASILALALAVVLGLAAASAAALVFMVVNPEGNLLLLLLLSQVWLFFAPRERTSQPQPDGGVTMKPQARATGRMEPSLAA